MDSSQEAKREYTTLDMGAKTVSVLLIRFVDPMDCNHLSRVVETKTEGGIFQKYQQASLVHAKVFFEQHPSQVKEGVILFPFDRYQRGGSFTGDFGFDIPGTHPEKEFVGVFRTEGYFCKWPPEVRFAYVAVEIDETK